MTSATLTENGSWLDSLAIRRRRGLSFAVLVVAVGLGWSLIWLGGEREVTPWWVSAVYPVFFGTAGVMCVRAGIRLTGDERKAWLCFGFAEIAYALAEMGWGIYESLLGVALPSPSIADIGYFTSGLFFICGLWYCHNRARSSEVTLVQLGNLGIVISTTLLVFSLVYYELLRATVPLAVATTAVVYGVLDVSAALVGFVVVYLHTWGQRRFEMLLLLLGLSAVATTDLVYTMTLVNDQIFSNAEPLNVVYLFAAGCFAWSGFERSQPTPSGVTDALESEFEDRAKQWETLVSPFAVMVIFSIAVVFRDRLSAELFPYAVAPLCLFVGSLGVRSWWGQRAETQLRAQALASEAALQKANIKLHEEMETRATAEEELRQSQKMEALGHLTGGVAHDFNNLLAVILSNLEMAEEKAPDQSDLREYLSDAIDASLRGASLTQRLLGLSRKQALRSEPIEMSALLDGMTSLLERTLGERIQVTIGESGTLWPCVADRAQLENTILNLAINSRDAMADGGELAIQARNVTVNERDAEHPEIQVGSYVVVSVRDTGTGMSDEIQSKVFDPFFTTKEIGAGTGLGLSMVYSFAKQSGGHVVIDSEIGQGTEVRLYLPRSESPAREIEAEASGEAPTGNGEAVLVVEDEPAVRKLVLTFLEDLGYSAVAVGDGEEALASLDAIGSLDLLLSDVVLPGQLTGRALVEAIKDRRPDAKVLLMSGYAPTTLVDDDQLGLDAELLNKPFRKIEFARKIRSVLDSD